MQGGLLQGGLQIVSGEAPCMGVQKNSYYIGYPKEIELLTKSLTFTLFFAETQYFGVILLFLPTFLDSELSKTAILIDLGSCLWDQIIISNNEYNEK